MPRLKASVPRRSRVIKLRATDAEHARFRSVARDAGVTVAELLRSLIMARRMPRRQRPLADPELLRAITRTSVALNDLAQQANSDHAAISAAAIISRLVAIERVLAEALHHAH
jgi:hypothetical protein